MGGRFVSSGRDTLAPFSEMDTSRPFTSRSVPTPIQQGRWSLVIDASKREHIDWFPRRLTSENLPQLDSALVPGSEVVGRAIVLSRPAMHAAPCYRWDESKWL